jgi:hypothetical protein
VVLQLLVVPSRVYKCPIHIFTNLAPCVVTHTNRDSIILVKLLSVAWTFYEFIFIYPSHSAQRSLVWCTCMQRSTVTSPVF